MPTPQSKPTQATLDKPSQPISKTDLASAMLERLRVAAQQAGLECLDTEWRRWHARYRFRCAQGHEYTRAAESVINQGGTCPMCRDQARLVRIQAAAQQRGGECLETHYLGSAARYRFVCAEGHQWSSAPNSLPHYGKWCPHCARQQHKLFMQDKNGLQRIQEAAHAQGGICLSTEYRGLAKRYTYRCAEGHEWEATGSAVALQKRWCWLCANARLATRRRLPDGLERLQAAARAKGGECLSLVYTHMDTHYHMRCAQGHEWQAFGSGILNGGWCSKCAYAAKRDSIELMQQLAQARGGRCLSTTYTGCFDKLSWECHRGHLWITAPTMIKTGHWCPTCARAANIRVPKPGGLERLQAAARAKGGECLSLVYINSDARYHMRCAKGHEWQGVGSKVIHGQWCPQCANEARRDSIENMHKIAQARGGRCLSTVYFRNTDKLTWECHHGHVWRAVPNSVKRGTWCQICGYMDKLSNPKSKARLKYLNLA